MTKVHPTHLGLALRACHVVAGLVPGINQNGAIKMKDPHPDTELPRGYEDAIDDKTGLNYMQQPDASYLPGTSPRYELVGPPVALSPEVQQHLDDMGYRRGEWIYLPALKAGEERYWPKVWDASTEEPAQPAVLGGNASGTVALPPTQLNSYTAETPEQERARLTGEVSLLDTAIEASHAAGVYPTDAIEVQGLKLIRLRQLADRAPAVPSAPDLTALVDRFLTWPVPADVHPDGIPGVEGRTGTNLMTATQARAMLAHVLGLPA